VTTVRRRLSCQWRRLQQRLQFASQFAALVEYGVIDLRRGRMLGSIL
jgi:hypothetical protein